MSKASVVKTKSSLISQMSERTAAVKRSRRKCQVRLCVTHSPSDGHSVSNPDNVKTYSSFHSVCAGEDLLLDAEEYSPNEDGKGTTKRLRKTPSANNSPKKCKDDKVPRVLAAMKRRSAVDTEDRPFKCTHCHWAFKKLCNLQSHLQTHSGLKPHVCDICGKAYSHQGTLQQHKRLHTGERPYHCLFCDKTYIWSSDYRKHIRTHTGEKPYICKTCGKDFIRSSDLRKHERNMHTNNKPFPCMHCECGVAFAMASRLVRHQFIHNNQKPYGCTGCGKNYSHLTQLKLHQEQTCILSCPAPPGYFSTVSV
uniref:Zinc finger protein 648 n=1 Tax=Poecilia latipinna TaxID=48699 RepID=A0A3B3UNC8_9TELE